MDNGQAVHVLELVRQHDIHELIRELGTYFYIITFIWTALEGETFVIFAGVAAQRGFLNIEFLFLAAWLGSFFGDQIYFLLGRKYGTRFLAKSQRIGPKLERIFKWLEKNAVLFILSYRFMYGVRNISGVAVGMSKLSWRKFAFLNLTASFIWALSFSGFGYLFGDVVARFSRQKEDVVGYDVRLLMLAALGAFALFIAIRWAVCSWLKKRNMGRL